MGKKMQRNNLHLKLQIILLYYELIYIESDKEFTWRKLLVEKTSLDP
jgi:hypothetical protein